MKLGKMLFSAVAALLFCVGSSLPSTAQTISVPEPEHFTVTVDYGMSLADMKAAGRYDRAIEGITEERFPMKGTGKVERTVELVRFNRSVTSQEAVKALERHGFRPATIEELLAFGAKYPDPDPFLRRMLSGLTIIALGSSLRMKESRDVPFLHYNYDGRSLRSGYWDDEWYGGDQFLAVRLSEQTDNK